MGRGNTVCCYSDTIEVLGAVIMAFINVGYFLFVKFYFNLLNNVVQPERVKF